MDHGAWHKRGAHHDTGALSQLRSERLFWTATSQKCLHNWGRFQWSREDCRGVKYISKRWGLNPLEPEGARHQPAKETRVLGWTPGRFRQHQQVQFALGRTP